MLVAGHVRHYWDGAGNALSWCGWETAPAARGGILPDSGGAQAGGDGGAECECSTSATAVAPPLPSPPVSVALLSAVAVCFEKNTALSRGWCTPLTRGSAVCGAKRIAQHANPGLLSSPVRLSAFSQNVIKRNQV